jgi:predicted transcriptional regulator
MSEGSGNHNGANGGRFSGTTNAGPPLLQQAMRRRMMEVIRRAPGIKISQLCRETSAGWGTVKYHLHLLRRAGLIVARSTGRDCLLFSADYPLRDLPVAAVLRRGRAEHLAQAIKETPGASQKELCERVHMTRKIIRRYVELLSSAGLVSERRDAQYQRYYPNPRLLEHLRQEAAPPPQPEAAAPPEPAPRLQPPRA